MKKIYSHPLFCYSFALLGLVGMGLQFNFLGNAMDPKGLLNSWHAANIATYVLLAATAVIALLSAPHVHTPALHRSVRTLGTGLGCVFCALAAGIVLWKKNYLLFGLCTLSTAAAVYILWALTTHRRPHYLAHGIFAVCFMFYLISRYRVYSAEPETGRYVFKILALICTMLAFYYQAAIRAGAGRFRSYHFFRSMTLFLTFAAVPASDNPMLYLAAALWLMADPLPRPSPREAAK